MKTLEKFYGTRNRSGFARVLEDARIKVQSAGSDWYIIRHLGEDDYHSAIAASDAVPAGYVISCLVTADGSVIAS